jgi:glutamate/tyrosine decarboxylase-like PLP-dependent enzyme
MGSRKKWAYWRRFPNPRSGGILVAPLGAGCYQLRRADTGEKVIFGMARNVARRMSSLLPWSAGGGGHRNNAAKRNYVLRHLGNIQYRTCACTNVNEARALERQLRSERHRYHT